jgi:phosphoribosylpyrophosphate synthetase
VVVVILYTFSKQCFEVVEEEEIEAVVVVDSVVADPLEEEEDLDAVPRVAEAAEEAVMEGTSCILQLDVPWLLYVRLSFRALFNS